MRFLYLSALFLLVSCSKEDKLNTCGLVGEWACCDNCLTWWNGAPYNERITFEEDGDLFSSDDYNGTRSSKWKTDGDCTEIVYRPGTEDESKVKIEINGDELVFLSSLGDRTFCRQ